MNHTETILFEWLKQCASFVVIHPTLGFILYRRPGKKLFYRFAENLAEAYKYEQQKRAEYKMSQSEC
jgi:hypothetical protein